MNGKLVAIVLLFLAWLWVAPSGAATLASFEFANPQQQQEFRALISQLRCLVCQNESLAESNAELAQDLRQEIYEMFMAGKSKDDIVGFMVARYGDFVLYSPPLRPSTYPLWFGPILLLLFAGFMLVRALRRRQRANETELSAEEQQRLATLLAPRTGDKRENT
jgi:cytochrome c-type biogenesis protein CcmH